MKCENNFSVDSVLLILSFIDSCLPPVWYALNKRRASRDVLLTSALMCVCLCVCLSVCLSVLTCPVDVGSYVCVSTVCLSVSLVMCVCLSVCLSVSLVMCVCLSVCKSGYVCVSVCLSVSLVMCVCLSVCL